MVNSSDSIRLMTLTSRVSSAFACRLSGQRVAREAVNLARAHLDEGTGQRVIDDQAFSGVTIRRTIDLGRHQSVLSHLRLIGDFEAGVKHVLLGGGDESVGRQSRRSKAEKRKDGGEEWRRHGEGEVELIVFSRDVTTNE